jgi:ABC-type multidrug transport system fused ATPase/permease subunit
MKNGKIEEIGTHDELIQAGKEYTRLYTAQEQWYS